MRDDKARLGDILEAIGAIERHHPKDRSVLEADEMLQVWLLHHLQIIGEAARGLTEALKQRHPEVPWAELSAMRNVLVHQYFGIDSELVWQALRQDLSPLKASVLAILTELGD